jgi:hypothetical protein
MGIDHAYGSSSSGIVITQFEDGHVQILHAEETKDPTLMKCFQTRGICLSNMQYKKYTLMVLILLS